MQALKIIGMSILAAVIYGIVHDQFTVRVCLEYFTIAHPKIFDTENPTLLAIGWGIIATWWAGLLVGIPLAIAAQVGKRPKHSAASLFIPMVIFLSILGACAIAAGFFGWWLGGEYFLKLDHPLSREIPTSRHAVFLAAASAHTASYVLGFLGGLILAVWTWKSRSRLPVPRSP